MNNIQELLDLAEPIFLQIDEAVKATDFKLAVALLDSLQPIEWQKELTSEATGLSYYHNDIELIEGVCERVFDFYRYKIKNTIITPTKTGLVITITVKVTVGWDSFSDTVFVRSGIASEFVSNAKNIPLSTPKCATIAFKNGIKKMGNLLGKSLNRNLENAPVESVNVFTDTKSEFEKSCEAAETVEDLAKLKIGITPAQIAIYMKHLKRLNEKI